MSTVAGKASKDPTELILEEADRRLDTYYEVVRPGDEDSPIPPMGMGSTWFIIVVAVALVALWLIGRFVVLPMYV